jgi:hypothetical protein
MAWPSVRTIVVLLAAVTILALALFVLAPWFEAARSWDRAMAVACYASTPVLLSWFLLLFPPFAVLPIVALLHCFALCYLGVQQLLDCRESEAAMFVAGAWVFSAVAGMLLGGLCSAAGLI